MKNVTVLATSTELRCCFSCLEFISYLYVLKETTDKEPLRIQFITAWVLFSFGKNIVFNRTWE